MYAHTDLYRIGVLGVGVDGDFTGEGESTSVRVDTGYIIFIISTAVSVALQHAIHHYIKHFWSNRESETHIELLYGVSSQWHNFARHGSIMTASGTCFTAKINDFVLLQAHTRTHMHNTHNTHTCGRG